MYQALIVLALVFTAPAFAQERKLTADEIRSVLSDKIVEGTDDSGRRYTQSFLKDGLTVFNVMPTSSSRGAWDVRGDQYCSQWPPDQNWVCYDMTANGPILNFIAADGKVWPVKVLN